MRHLCIHASLCLWFPFLVVAKLTIHIFALSTIKCRMCGGEGSELEGNFIKPLILEREKKCKCNRLSGPIVAFYYFLQLSLSLYMCLHMSQKASTRSIFLLNIMLRWNFLFLWNIVNDVRERLAISFSSQGGVNKNII